MARAVLSAAGMGSALHARRRKAKAESEDFHPLRCEISGVQGQSRNKPRINQAASKRSDVPAIMMELGNCSSSAFESCGRTAHEHGHLLSGELCHELTYVNRRFIKRIFNLRLRAQSATVSR